MAVLLAAVFLAAGGCRQNAPVGTAPVNTNAANADRGDANSSAAESPTAADEQLRRQVAAFCGDCHAVPPATSFAKADWKREVARAYEIYRRSGRQDLSPPDESAVVAYYENLAPDKLAFPQPQLAAHPSPFRFRQQLVFAPGGAKELAVSSLVWDVPAGATKGRLLLCDMRQGIVGQVQVELEPQFEELARFDNPASIEPADLDGDGRTDYLVADLGDYLPQDHSFGRVLWLRQDQDGKWESQELAQGLGRVAQAVAGDFNGDGQEDVLVAEFGWITTGRILLLTRSGGDAEAPQFETAILDPRHGVSHLRKVDWDRDGDLDFVALVTQEHEKVELFLQQEDHTFRVETLFSAADPNFGSSGIELVDLDADGDLDVLLTNGDAMDSFQVKPFHAVRWLENRGSFPFAEHVLATMPGVFKALAADFDLDGDLDVAALSFPPENVRMGMHVSPPDYHLMEFIEQTAPGQFARHAVRIRIGGAAMTAGDFDGDGDTDLATGNFGYSASGHWGTIWWNEGR